MSSWIKMTLGEAINFRRGHDLPKTQMNDGKVPVVGSNGIIGYHDEYTTESPCVTIGRSGNVGNPNIVYTRCWAHNTTLYIDDFKGNDEIFIYYFLLTLELRNYRGGSAVPTLNRNHIHPIEVRIPPRSTQRKIAAILSALDDKIENNRKTCEKLEEIAAAVFKRWFVDFEFPDAQGKPYKSNGGKMMESELGLIPEGWEVKNFEEMPIEIVDGDRGVNYPNKTEFQDEGYCLFLNAGNVTKTGFSFNDTQFITKEKDELLRKGKAQRNDIILTTRGTVGNIAYYSNYVTFSQIRINSGMVIIRVNIEKMSLCYFYNFVSSKYFEEQIQRLTSGSAQPQLPIRDIKKINIVFPKDAIHSKYEEHIKPVIELIEYNKQLNDNLKQTRDTLLPKLISGELSVEEEEG